MWGYSGGFLALLEEGDIDYQIYAIDQLQQVVDLEWATIAEKLDLIKKLADDESFHYHPQAALLAARTLYRLGDFDTAVDYAVKSGKLFDSKAKDDFSTTIKSQLITRCRNYANNKMDIEASVREILYEIFDDLFENHDYAALFCIALETRQEKYICQVLKTLPELLPYAIRLVVKGVSDNEYRAKCLGLILQFLQDQCDKDMIAKVHQSLNDPESVAAMIIQLSVDGNELLAYQIAFDLAENASQKFRSEVINIIGDDFPNIKGILTRATPLRIEMEFHYQKSKEDLTLLQGFMEKLDTTVSTSHTALVTAFAYMDACTGNDQYYRDNSKWFGASTKWHKFYSVAGAGCVHIGHLQSALSIFAPYLTGKTDAEVTGAALLAIGLISANYAWDDKILNMVRSSLNAKQIYVQYGAALALGLINIGSQNADDCDKLKEILFKPDVQPETGEAVGYALGMINLGAGPCDLLNSIIDFAKDCKHDKIVRAISMACALMCYGHEHEADVVYDALINSRNPIIREGAAWTLALAYVGTGENDVAQKLLHVAVSDTSGDVRRVAVIGLGLLLSRHTERVPDMLGLLAISYHAHVRAGAAIAIGIALAGSGNKECIELIKPLLKDNDPLVRQSANIGMAMLLQQQSDAKEPYCKEFRQHLRKYLRKESGEMTTFALGAAYGILNATGRNTVISCNTLRGVNSMISTVGIALFTQYLYFIPLALMLPLSFHTTAMIPLDKDLKVVEWPVLCKCKPSLFADPPTFAEEKPVKKVADKVELSITREMTKKEKEEEEKKKEEEKKQEELKASEPEQEMIINPSRVTLEQIKYIDSTFSADWKPVISPSLGFIMLEKIGQNEME